MGSRRFARGRFAGAAWIAVVLLTGTCATDLPVTPDRMEAALPSDATVYMAIRPEHLRELIGDIAYRFELDASEIGELIDSSNRVVTALGSGGNEAEIAAIASGDYPGGRMRFGLTMSRRWRRRTVSTAVSSRPWFEERDGPGQLAIASSSLVLFSGGGLEEMMIRAAESEPPEEVFYLDEEAELSLVLPRIGEALRAGLPSQARVLPLERIEVNVHMRDSERELPFELSGRIDVGSEQAARVLSVIARLVIGSLAEGVPLADLSVEREAEVITFAGLPADEERLREWAGGFLETLGAGVATG